jgi:O-antigen ligase
VVFEVFVCIVEYALQVRTFFLASYPKIDFTSNFLYDYRTFGLSVNSSVVSFKILCALILLELKLFKKWTYYFILIILYIGAIVTFNRALLLTIFFMSALQFLLSLFADQHKLKRMRQAATPTILFILIFVAFSKNSIWTELNKRHPEKQQLGVVHPRAKNKTIASLGCNDQYQPNLQIGQQLDTSLMLNRLLIRNTAQVNTSGRTLIWANYLQFIHGHLWFGNGSDKLYFKEKNPETGAVKLIHAHNSFLQLLATNGILLSSLLLLILCFIWQRKHLILIITLLFFSVFQYGIFWGFSILDVLLVSLLLSDFERKNEPY